MEKLMHTFELIEVDDQGDLGVIRMDRAERRNAFNSQMISELTVAFKLLNNNQSRLIVLTGNGSAFSAGADLEYMRQIKDSGYEANYADASALADLLELIYTSPKPVIAGVNGPAIGGGTGLISACDIAIAKDDVFFAFSEVRLGLVPAVIGPYVVKAIGERNSRRYMLTGDRFSAEKAKEIGLINEITDDIEKTVNEIADSILLCGPNALMNCKKLIRRCGEEELSSIKDWTSDLIATLRASVEGQEGMSSFLNKRNPNWKSS
jgi:methylglutaconyl-CoA hydratase